MHALPDPDGPVLQRRTLPEDGRWYLLHVPPGLDPGRPAPLVLEFHGSGSVPEDQMRYSALHRLADTHGFLLAAPAAAIPLRMFDTQPDGLAWHVPGVPLVETPAAADRPDPGQPPDDLDFVRRVVRDVAREHSVDRRRIYAAGFSGGGRFCSYLAFNAPGLLAAVATVAGLRLPGTREPQLPPPIIAFHGTADPVNPFRGGAGRRWDLDVPVTADLVARGLECRRPAALETVSAAVTRQVYTTPAGEVRLVAYTAARAGHHWPGTPHPEYTLGLGPLCHGIDASALIWEFFAPRVTAGST